MLTASGQYMATLVEQLTSISTYERNLRFFAESTERSVEDKGTPYEEYLATNEPNQKPARARVQNAA